MPGNPAIASMRRGKSGGVGAGDSQLFGAGVVIIIVVVVVTTLRDAGVMCRDDALDVSVTVIVTVSGGWRPGRAGVERTHHRHHRSSSSDGRPTQRTAVSTVRDR